MKWYQLQGKKIEIDPSKFLVWVAKKKQVYYSVDLTLLKGHSHKH
jgi:hypothetical protein